MELDDLEDFTLLTMSMGGPQVPRERVPRQIVPCDHHEGYRRIWADYFAPQRCMATGCFDNSASHACVT
jgi:hypothetical protein